MKSFEMNHSMASQNTYSKLIKLSTGEKLRYHKVEYVLRYQILNNHKNREAYEHHLKFMFYPFRGEVEIKMGNLPHTVKTLQKPDIINLINANKNTIDPLSQLIDLDLM